MLLNIPRACKTYKHAFFMNQMVTSEQFPDKIVCPVKTLKKYISRTKKLCNVMKIFITTTPLFKAASTQTLPWWVHDAMQASGMDMTVFHLYSTHAASVSKTVFTSGSLKAAIDKGHWHTTNAFYRH